MRKPVLEPMVLALALWPAVVCAGSLAPDGGPLFRWGGAATSNMANTATNLPSDLDNLTPLWELRLGQHQYAIPTIDRGRIYLCADDTGVERAGYTPTRGGVVMCVEQATGKLIWQLPCPRYLAGVKPPYHFDQWGCGICSGPVVEGERIYVIGNRGEILCLDRAGQANGNQGPVLDELEYMGVTPAPGSLTWISSAGANMPSSSPAP